MDCRILQVHVGGLTNNGPRRPRGAAAGAMRGRNLPRGYTALPRSTAPSVAFAGSKVPARCGEDDGLDSTCEFVFADIAARWRAGAGQYDEVRAASHEPEPCQHVEPCVTDLKTVGHAAARNECAVDPTWGWVFEYVRTEHGDDRRQDVFQHLWRVESWFGRRPEDNLERRVNCADRVLILGDTENGKCCSRKSRLLEVTASGNVEPRRRLNMPVLRHFDRQPQLVEMVHHPTLTLLLRRNSARTIGGEAIYNSCISWITAICKDFLWSDWCVWGRTHCLGC